MPKLYTPRQLLERLPLQYRVLCRQFILRVVDLESLSVQADIPRYLGQFGGVLLMLSFLHTVFVYFVVAAAPWFAMQYLVRSTMLVAGFVTVLCWDGMFPDRRDVMVLGMLPLRTTTILLATISATASLVVLSALLLNLAPGLMVSFVAGTRHASLWGTLQVAGSYGLTMASASLFLYCGAHTVQGTLRLLFPWRVYLRMSAVVQMAALTALLAMYFITPAIKQPQALLVPATQSALGWSPLYWFVAVFHQLNSTLPTELGFLARRGWIALTLSFAGATASLLLGYRRSMKQTVEQQELVPSRQRATQNIPAAGVRAAMLLFDMRSLLRSRQHRSIYGFFCSLELSIALSCARDAWTGDGKHAVNVWFLGSTVLLMSVAVLGLRSVSSLPITLGANWMMRVTKFGESRLYLSSARRFMFFFALLPAWLLCAALALLYSPVFPSLAHLAVLVAVGWIALETGLLGATKVPFACSFLPGKSNVQARFWTFILFMLPVAQLWGLYERSLLAQPRAFATGLTALTALAVLLHAWNRRTARTAALVFEETEAEEITTLGLGGAVLPT